MTKSKWNCINPSARRNSNQLQVRTDSGLCKVSHWLLQALLSPIANLHCEFQIQNPAVGKQSGFRVTTCRYFPGGAAPKIIRSYVTSIWFSESIGVLVQSKHDDWDSRNLERAAWLCELWIFFSTFEGWRTNNKLILVTINPPGPINCNNWIILGAWLPCQGPRNVTR